MATYVTLTAPEGASARGVRMPLEAARLMVSIAETIVGVDPDAHASYHPALGLSPSTKGFGRMPPTDAWTSLRNALVALDPADEPLPVGAWSVGRATVA